MKVLVLGEGGREHSIVRALKWAPSVTQLYCVPGNAGIQRDAVCKMVEMNDFGAIEQLSRQLQIDLIVVGPEQPLVLGLADHLRSKGFAVLGAGSSAAALEGSKVFAKTFMNEWAIPTAPYDVVQSVSDVEALLKKYQTPYVLKADGLAAGKGVFICDSADEVLRASENLFNNKVLGEAGAKAVLEECLSGWELSYLILTNGQSYANFPIAQDHKRLSDGNKGPNTGGMGAIAPVPLSDSLDAQIRRQIIEPVLMGLSKREISYRGVLYVGIMVTEQGPKVLEFNVRLGDPEAQVLLPLLHGDWGDVFLSVARGVVPQLKWKLLNTACVVLASPGYPDRSVIGIPVDGDSFAETPSSYFIHAGTSYVNGEILTSGGRVLNSIGIGSSFDEALAHAYAQVKFVKWQGMQFRADIGKCDRSL